MMTYSIFSTLVGPLTPPNDSSGSSRNAKCSNCKFLIEKIKDTKWKGSRAMEGNGYKLWYSGSSNARNGEVVIEGETANVISACAPQVGLSDAKKKRFWDALHELVRECPTDQRLIIGGDLNGHIKAVADGYTGVYGGFGFGDRNEEGCTILEFATEHELVVANSFFKKSDAHLITFQSGGHNTQIDYLLVRRGDLRACKDCRAYPGEACSSQHRVEVMSTSGANQMWNTLACVMKDAAKESLGVANKTARTHSTHKESWWFCDEERYKVTKRKAKIAVVNAKDKAYKDLYKKLDSKEGTNDIYKIAKARERRMDIGNVRYIKDEGGRTISRRRQGSWEFKSTHALRMLLLEDQPRRNEDCIKEDGRNKAVGLDQIPIEAWRSLEDEGVKWLTCLFNKIFSSAKMPDDLRLSEVISIYKNKGDAQACSNYRGIKLLSHSNKLWERVIERSLMEKYRERKRDFHMAFLDLEKAYDSVPHDIVLIAESTKGLNNRLESWRKALEDNGLRVAIRPTMLYGSECWPITKAQATRVEVAELRMLSRQDEGRVRWFGHVKRRNGIPRLEDLKPWKLKARGEGVGLNLDGRID
nr:hypothetical protein [Tanacetum cinerariifolium]